MYELASAVIAGDSSQVLHIVDAIARQGFEMPHVAKDFLALLRDVVVAATCKDPSEILDLPEEEQRDVQKLATHSVDDLLRLHQGFSQGYDDVVRAAFPRAALEMLLIRLARRPPLVPIDDLLDRLVQLEKRLRQAGASSGANSAATSSSRSANATHAQPPATAPSPPATRPPASTQMGRREPATSSAARKPAEGGDRSSDDDGEPAPLPSSPKTDALGVHASRERPVQRPETSVSPPSRATTSRRAPLPSVDVQPGSTPAESASVTRLSRPAHPPPSDVVTSTPREALDLFELPPWERWRRIVDPIRRTDAALGAFLDHAVVFEISKERLRVGFERDSVFRNTANEPETRQQILRSAEALLQSKPLLEWVENAPASDPTGRTVFAVDKQARVTRHREALERARSHPVVEAAVRVLGARVRNIEIPET
jgi:DNA polymerase-3 subunit gamma/tau